MKRSLEEYERAKSKIAQLEKDIKRMNGKIQSQMEMEEDFKNQCMCCGLFVVVVLISLKLFR